MILDLLVCLMRAASLRWLYWTATSWGDTPLHLLIITIINYQHSISLYCSEKRQKSPPYFFMICVHLLRSAPMLARVVTTSVWPHWAAVNTALNLAYHFYQFLYSTISFYHQHSLNCKGTFINYVIPNYHSKEQ